jgi:hypothetical protein
VTSARPVSSLTTTKRSSRGDQSSAEGSKRLRASSAGGSAMGSGLAGAAAVA